MNHDQARDLLAELALDVIADEERKGVEGHIAECEICALEAHIYVQAGALLPIAALAGPHHIEADTFDRIRAAMVKGAHVVQVPRPRLRNSPALPSPHAEAISVHAPPPAKERGLRGIFRRAPAPAEEFDEFSSDLFADVTPLTDEELAIRSLERDWDEPEAPPQRERGFSFRWKDRKDEPSGAAVALATPLTPPAPAVAPMPPVARVPDPPSVAPVEARRPPPRPASLPEGDDVRPRSRSRLGFGRLRRQAGAGDAEGSDIDFPVLAPLPVLDAAPSAPAEPAWTPLDLALDLDLVVSPSRDAGDGAPTPESWPAEAVDEVQLPSPMFEPGTPVATDAVLGGGLNSVDITELASEPFIEPDDGERVAGPVADGFASNETAADIGPEDAAEPEPLPASPPVTVTPAAEAPAPHGPALPPGDPFAFLDDLMREDDLPGPFGPADGDDGGRRSAGPGPSTRRRGFGRARRGTHHEDDYDDLPMDPGGDAFGIPADLGEEPGELAEAGRRRFGNRIREEAQAELAPVIPEFRGDRALDDAIQLAVAPSIVAVPGVTAPMPGTILARYDRDDDDAADEEDEAMPARRAEYEDDEEGGDPGGWRAWAILLGLVAAIAIAGLGFTFYQLRETRNEANVLQQKVQSFAVQIGLRGDDFVGIAYMLPTYTSGILVLDGIPTLPTGREYVVWAEGSEGIKSIRTFQAATPSRTYVDLPRMPAGFRQIFITEEARQRSGLRAAAPSGPVLVSGVPPIR